MKLHLLAVLSCCIFGFGASAQICSFDVEKQDHSSGDTIRRTIQRLGEYQAHWNIILEQKGNQYFVSLMHVQSPAVNARIQPGDAFSLRLDDGNEIRLAADQEYTPEQYHGGKSCVIFTSGKISVAQLEQLSKAHLTEVKLTVGGTDYMQSGISEQQVIRVANLARCLLLVKND